MKRKKSRFDLKVGVDIIYIPRIKEILDSDEREAFVNRCFAESEISESKQKRNLAEYLSGRFALKEALVKINGDRNGIRFSEIMVDSKRGRPILKYSGTTKKIFAKYDISFSISHDKDYAIAVAIGREK